jgi:hypothetical protein
MRWQQNKTKTTEYNQDDLQIPQPDLRFAARETAQQQRTGARAQPNNHTKAT